MYIELFGHAERCIIIYPLRNQSSEYYTLTVGGLDGGKETGKEEDTKKRLTAY
jgi:hypothetical protein